MITKKEQLDLKIFATHIRLETLRCIGSLGAGHLGGCFSIADLLAVLYGREMRIRPNEPCWPDRDYLVVSKGHAGPALYATLSLKGFFPLEALDTLNRPKTHLPSHCDRNLTTGVDMTTGSLGQGASLASGIALGNKLEGRPSQTYLILGDGECDEGQVWESLLFMAQQKLNRLIVFVDHNKKQLDGYTADVLCLHSLEEKFRAFGLHTLSVQGHDVAAISEAIAKAKAADQLSAIILDTVKGKGISELEEMPFNHHISVSPSFLESAVKQLELVLRELEEEKRKCL